MKRVLGWIKGHKNIFFKVFKFLIYVFAVVGIISFILWLLGYRQFLKEDAVVNWVAIGAVGSVGAFFAIWLTTKRQIENQNRQLNRPYLTIDEINRLSESDIDNEDVFCTVCRAAHNLSNDDEDNYSKCKNEIISIVLRNIGYGIASNIRFYSLVTNNIIGAMKSTGDVPVSRSFPTREIEKNGKSRFFFDVSCYFSDGQNSWKDPDGTSILLLYTDLNENLSMVYIGITFDSEFPIDYTFYQQDTSKFKKMMKKNNANISIIKKKYFEI